MGYRLWLRNFITSLHFVILLRKTFIYKCLERIKNSWPTCCEKLPNYLRAVGQLFTMSRPSMYNHLDNSLLKYRESVNLRYEHLNKWTLWDLCSIFAIKSVYSVSLLEQAEKEWWRVFYLPQSTLRPLIYHFKIDSTTSCHLLFTCRHPVCCSLSMEPPATLLGRRHTSWTAIQQDLHRFSWPIGVWSVEC